MKLEILGLYCVAIFVKINRLGTAPWGQKWPMTNLIENSPRQINTIGGLIGAILTYFSQKNQISRVLLGDRPLGKV